MRYGERRAIEPFAVAIRFPQQVERRTAWLGFEIVGDGVVLEAGLDPKTGMPPGRVTRGTVRVYACDARSLDGRIDQARLRRLESFYDQAC